MNKKIFAILMVLICALSISAVSAADSDANDVNEVATEIGSFAQLKDVVDKNQSVILGNDYEYKDADKDIKTININKDMTIDGNGHNIDGKNGITNSIFTIAKDTTVTIKNVNFKNALGVNGGAINNNGNLILINCSFDTLQATELGGAIYNNGTLTVENSKFVNNQAKLGGAIYNNGTLTVENSTFPTDPSSENKQANMIHNDIYSGINKYIKLINTNAKTIIETSMTLGNVANVIATQNATISGTVSSKANGTVTIKVNGNVVAQDVVVKNGKFNTAIKALANGTYNATVIFTGTEVNGTNYTSCNATTNKFNVTKATVEIKLFDITSVLLGDKVTISGLVYGMIDGDKVAVIINGGTATEAIVKDGEFSVNVTANTVGVNNVTVKVADVNRYVNSSVNTTFKVQNPTSIAIDNISTVEFGKNFTVSGTVTGIATNATLTVTVNGVKVADAIVKDGKFGVNVTANQGGFNKVTVSFAGNDTHAKSSNETKFNVTNSSTTIKIFDIKDVEFGKNFTVSGTVEGIADGAKLNIAVNGVNVANATVKDGKFSVNVTASQVGDNEVIVSFAGNNTHNKSAAGAEFIVTEVSTSIAINNISSILVGENVAISGNVTGIADGATVTVAVNKVNVTNATIKDGKFSVNIPTNNKSVIGVNNVTVSFAGNKTHVKSSANATFKIRVKTSIDIYYTDIADFGKNITIKADVTNIADGAKVTVIVNNVSKIVTVMNGKVIANVTANTVGVNSIIVTFAGNDTHTNSFDKANFTVNNVPTSTGIYHINTVLVDKNATIAGTVEGIDGAKVNGNVTVSVNGVKVAYCAVKDGKFSVNVIADVIGVNNVTVSFAGNDKYLKSSANATFNVVKLPISTSIVIDDISAVKFGENVTISGNMTGIVDGDKVNVTVTVNDIKVNAVVENGKFSVNVIADVIGVNNVTVSFAGDDTYVKSSAKANFTVTKGSASIAIDPITAIVGENVIVSGTTVPSVANITVTANGKTFNVTVTNGTFTLDIGNFTKEGNQTIVVKYDGNENYNATTVSEVFTVVKKEVVPTATLTVPDVTLFFKNGTQLVIYLTSNGTKLSNETVKINLNGINYTKTVMNGTASLGINLAPGKYNVAVSLVSDKYTAASVNATVTVLPVIVGNDTVLYFKNGTKYVAVFLDGKGNPLEGAKIQFNINGVKYNRTTDANGTASLNINLAPGKYIITVTNLDNTAVTSNTITVLPTIIGKNIVKYYKNETQYVVKVVDGKGNALANQTVEYNINGVFYKRTTDVNGTAVLSINLPAGNSEPKDYIVTAWCNGCIISNNVTVSPVLTAKDFNETFQAGKKFTANIVDGKGNPLEGAKIQFNINGVFYNKVSDVNGTASLNINLAPGEYIITSTCNDNGAVISNKVTVTPKV